MKLLAAAVLSLSIVAGAANDQQTIEGVKAMPTTEDIRAVAPAVCTKNLSSGVVVMKSA